MLLASRTNARRELTQWARSVASWVKFDPSTISGSAPAQPSNLGMYTVLCLFISTFTLHDIHISYHIHPHSTLHSVRRMGIF